MGLPVRVAPPTWYATNDGGQRYVRGHRYLRSAQGGIIRTSRNHSSYRSFRNVSQRVRYFYIISIDISIDPTWINIGRLERTEPNLMHFTRSSRVNRHSLSSIPYLADHLRRERVLENEKVFKADSSDLWHFKKRV